MIFLHPSKNDGDSYEKTVNPLLISDDDNSHCIVITDLNKLLWSEVNSDGHHFSNCLRMFCSEITRDEHYCQCTTDLDPTIVMPQPDGCNNMLKFKNICQQLHHLRVLYIDMEMIQPRELTYVFPTQTDLVTHIPCRYCCYMHDDHGQSVAH